MKLSSQIKPISYLKAHAAEIVRKLHEHREPAFRRSGGTTRVRPAWAYVNLSTLTQVLAEGKSLPRT